MSVPVLKHCTSLKGAARPKWRRWSRRRWYKQVVEEEEEEEPLLLVQNENEIRPHEDDRAGTWRTCRPG